MRQGGAVVSALARVFADNRVDVGGLSLADAWDLEERLGEARAVVSEFIDAEIGRLVSEGWTQARIAEECGRSQKTISNRMYRLGIEPVSTRGRPRISSPSNSLEPDEAVVDAEVVDADAVEAVDADTGAAVVAEVLPPAGTRTVEPGPDVPGWIATVERLLADDDAATFGVSLADVDALARVVGELRRRLAGEAVEPLAHELSGPGSCSACGGLLAVVAGQSHCFGCGAGS